MSVQIEVSEAMSRLIPNKDFAVFMAWLTKQRESAMKGLLYAEEGRHDLVKGHAQMLDQVILAVKAAPQVSQKAATENTSDGST